MTTGEAPSRKNLFVTSLKDKASRQCGAVTLVTLFDVTDAATMAKISFWRYMAVNRKTLLAGFACALLVFSMLGCGQTNDLKSIQLTAALINNVVPTSQSGIYNLSGDGATIQLKATGVYSSGKTKDLTNMVTYSVIVDPNYTQTYTHQVLTTLLPPCQAPACPNPSAPPFTQGTVEYSPTGLITAVEPATCSWEQDGSGWFFQGAYQVTVSFEGITSQAIQIPVASEAGPFANGACGPTT
jgi:hypothetical protein